MLQSDSLEKRLIQIIEAQHHIHERLRRVEAFMDGSSPSKTINDDRSNLPARKAPRLAPRQDELGPLFAGDSFSALRMRFSRQTRCEQWCDCRCHTYQRGHASQSLESFLGALFYGYSNMPSATPSCSNSSCRRSSETFVQINYYFPIWFFAWALSVAVRIQSFTVPKFKLRILNIRDSYEEIFQCAISNDARSVQYLLSSSQASVRDISDDSGHSPLHIAVRGGNVEVIKILLQHGAEPYLENRKQETPYDTASDNIFYFQGTPNSLASRTDEMRELFPITEWVEERRMFTHVHKIVLQLLALDLEKALRKKPLSVDKGDADGRTPLSWAAARGDNKSVELLLRYGASPNTPDRIGQGPLRQSLKACDSKCLQLLLEYGANVDQTDDWEQTCLLAAHYYPDPVSFTSPLLAAGAQVNSRCSQGRFPLMEAVSKNNVAAVKLLMKYKADVNLANNIGATALHEGVRHNSHEALAILLEADLDHTMRDTKGRTVLHYAAQFGDLKMLKILHRERLFGLNADDQDIHHLTPIQIAEDRQNEEKARGSNTINLEWIATFADLLETLLAFNTPVSVPSYSGSIASEESFLDALQHLRVEQHMSQTADLTVSASVMV